jgi:uncharacterized protein (DUF58 family)
MISPEVLKRIRRIEITTSRMVSDVFAGQYHSVFKGKGMEFEEVREYQPGDDIRSIDWNVTAKTGHPYVKKFVEERELTVMLVLDLSMSCYFGSVRQLKNQLAAEICSVLAFSAIKNNDKVGLVIFTDKIEKFVPPRKGIRHVLRVIREVLYYQPKSKRTDISLALQYLNKVMRRKAITFLISDFFCPDFKKFLSITNKHHDIIAVTITDPRETQLPNVGILKLNDAETQDSFVLDTSNAEFRKKYAQDASSRKNERERLLRSTEVDVINIRTDIPYYIELIKFFKMRERRLA